MGTHQEGGIADDSAKEGNIAPINIPRRLALCIARTFGAG
jgi:hypothetical protein